MGDFWDDIPILGPVRRGLITTFEMLTGSGDSESGGSGGSSENKQGEGSTQGGSQGQGGEQGADTRLVNGVTSNTPQSSYGSQSPVSSVTGTTTVNPVITNEVSDQLEQAQEVAVQSQAQGDYDIANAREQTGSALSVSPVLFVNASDVNTTSSTATEASPSLVESIAPIAIAACLGYFGVQAIRSWRDSDGGE